MKSFLPEWLEMVQKNHQQSEDHWINLLHQISSLWYTKYNYPSSLLNQVDSPILLLIGDHDQFVPLSHFVDLFQILPNTELAVIPNGSHHIDREKPEEFCKLVIEYFQRQLV